MYSFSGTQPKRYNKTLRDRNYNSEDISFSLSKFLPNHYRLDTSRPILPSTTKNSKNFRNLHESFGTIQQVSKGNLSEPHSGKAKTALSNSFHHFESNDGKNEKEINRIYSKMNDSINLTNIRPKFLEPEVNLSYVPNKSYFMARVSNKMYSKLPGSYKFPNIRHKNAQDIIDSIKK